MSKTLSKRLERIKGGFEERNAVLQDEAFLFIQREVEKLCDRYHWKFSTAWGLKVCRNYGETKLAGGWDDEVDNTVLHELVYWYEEEFALFPEVIYCRGKWLPEDIRTPATEA